MSDISRLSRRLIPCLDVRDGRLTKGIKFEGNVDIGDPVETARRYYEEGADEIVFYDITASHESRGIFLDVVERVASCIFIPFSVGGGISTVEQMRAVLLAGAEKVSVNSAAVTDPYSRPFSPHLTSSRMALSFRTSAFCLASASCSASRAS